MLTTIANYLTALLQLLKQNHLLAKDYQEHLLYERLQQGIDDDIDKIKELALACGYSEDIANAQKSLKQALTILEQYQDIKELENAVIEEINVVISKLNDNTQEDIEDVFNQYKVKSTLQSVLDSISEKRIRDLYLLKFKGV